MEIILGSYGLLKQLTEVKNMLSKINIVSELERGQAQVRENAITKKLVRQSINI